MMLSLLECRSPREYSFPILFSRRIEMARLVEVPVVLSAGPVHGLEIGLKYPICSSQRNAANNGRT